MTGSDGWCLTLDSAVSGELLLLIHFLQTSACVCLWVEDCNIHGDLKQHASVTPKHFTANVFKKKYKIVHGKILCRAP